MKKVIYITFAALFLSLFTSCYSPNPFYGTWEDNSKSSIMFLADNSFSATINVKGTKKRYGGTYSVLENVLVFTKDDGTRSITEWDIRGGYMYLTWYDADLNENFNLVLFHTSK
ncbi:hypothetical protein [Treponema sp.]|uniref:hypothetical protein n=1 Tax=Treponema sp. TaxID=166 RepID=UPI00298DD3D1|nr:hypothetical protein [Treponema sp.]